MISIFITIPRRLAERFLESMVRMHTESATHTTATCRVRDKKTKEPPSCLYLDRRGDESERESIPGADGYRLRRSFLFVTIRVSTFRNPLSVAPIYDASCNFPAGFFPENVRGMRMRNGLQVAKPSLRGESVQMKREDIIVSERK